MRYLFGLLHDLRHVRATGDYPNCLSRDRLLRALRSPIAMLCEYQTFDARSSSPVAQIERVSENRLININPVTIHFRRPTEFGSSVTFMPRSRMLGLLSPHPVVGELELLAGIAGRV